MHSDWNCAHVREAPTECMTNTATAGSKLAAPMENQERFPQQRQQHHEALLSLQNKYWGIHHPRNLLHGE